MFSAIFVSDACFVHDLHYEVSLMRVVLERCWATEGVFNEACAVMRGCMYCEGKFSKIFVSIRCI